MQNPIRLLPGSLWMFYQAKLRLFLASDSSRVRNLLPPIAVHVSTFEILQIMKATWRDELISLIDKDTEVVIEEFESLLVADEEWNTWGQEYEYISTT
jgi:hypothetical protein